MSEAAPAQGLRLALIIICATQFMIVLDGTIMSVALAQINRGLGLGGTALPWVINAYTLAFGGFLLLGGRAADLFGQRRMLIAGVALFTAASLAGGLAPNGGLLIASRAVQGLGGALAAPATLSLIASMFAAGAARDQAVGVLGAIASAGAVSGVLLGGILTDFLGWRWVLLVNVPVGLLVIVLARRHLPGDAPAASWRALDLPGAATVTLGLVLLVYAVVGAGKTGLASGSFLLPLMCGFGLLAAFLVVETRVSSPLIHLSALKNRQLLAPLAIAFVHGSGPVTAFYFLALHLQRTLGYTPLETGLAFLPLAVCAAIGATLGSRLVTRLSPQPIMVAGVLTMILGLALLIPLGPDGTYVGAILPGLVAIGLGLALAAVPMTIAAVSSVPSEDSGFASGLLNTSQQIGTALALAVMVAVLTGRAGGTDRPAFLIGIAFLTVGTIASLILARRRGQPRRSQKVEQM